MLTLGEVSAVSEVRRLWIRNWVRNAVRQLTPGEPGLDGMNTITAEDAGQGPEGTPNLQKQWSFDVRLSPVM